MNFVPKSVNYTKRLLPTSNEPWLSFLLAVIFFKHYVKLTKNKRNNNTNNNKTTEYATEITGAGNIERWPNIKSPYVTSLFGRSKKVVVLITKNKQLNLKTLDYLKKFSSL